MTRVDSSFEAERAVPEAARHVFRKHGGKVGLGSAWVVQSIRGRVSRSRDERSSKQTGSTWAIEEKHAAGKLVHMAENLLKMPRLSILTQSHAGGPCPWRQMNKCVGPCEGRRLEAYSQLVAFSAGVLADRPITFASRRVA